LKPEWWGSPLAQEEKYQGRKKTCDKKKKIIIAQMTCLFRLHVLVHETYAHLAPKR
jgi:hypothetical protein